MVKIKVYSSASIHQEEERAHINNLIPRLKCCVNVRAFGGAEIRNAEEMCFMEDQGSLWLLTKVESPMISFYRSWYLSRAQYSDITEGIKRYYRKNIEAVEYALFP